MYRLPITGVRGVFIMSLRKNIGVVLRKLNKVTLLESFQEDADPEITFDVIDCVNPLLHWRDTRKLIFQHGSTYVYSTIYLRKYRRDQPIYYAVHQLIHSYLPRLSRLESALVLGCAGCSIPRFLALSAPKCKITGIEYSEKMIEIAKKYFVNDPAIFRNFQLLHADAFTYVHDVSAKYQLTYVDLFLADKNHPQIFTDGFLRDLDSITAKESVTIINLLNLSKADAARYLLRLTETFPAVYLYNDRFHYYGVLIKTENPATLKRFEARAAKSVRLEERFISPAPRTQ